MRFHFFHNPFSLFLLPIKLPVRKEALFMKIMNKEAADKCKAFGQDAFVKIGNMAVGNSSSDDRRGDTQRAAFTVPMLWPYEKPMPKRRSK